MATMMSEILLGSHLSLAAPSYYLGTCEEAASFGETTFMFYTGAPQNTRRSPTSLFKIEEGRAFLFAHHFDESKIVVHAPYIINLGNNEHQETYELAERFLGEEMVRVSDFGLSLLLLHPGSAVGMEREKALASVSAGLNEVLSKDSTSVTICLETMAGKGSELGIRFEEIAAIIAGVEKKERIGVCLDTCHINDAGYDVKDVKGILDQFDKIIGLSRLKVVHLNDSKNPQGSHKDRHENIGYGTLGFDTLEAWVKEPRLASIPKILETPMAGEKYPYAKEIAMLRAGSFIPKWRENL
jgi:deoxyribonuclease-4